MNKFALAVLLFFCLLFGLVIAALTQTYKLSSNGIVKGVGVSISWLNGSECTSIDWGVVDNNTETTLSEPLNITNTNNTACTLSLSTENLSSNIISLSLTWNYSGSPLQPQEWTLVTLMLNASVTNHEIFTWDTVITAHD